MERIGSSIKKSYNHTQQDQALVEAEHNRGRAVLTRLLAVIQSLAV